MADQKSIPSSEDFISLQVFANQSGLSIRQIIDLVLIGKITSYCWAQVIGKSVPNDKKHVLCPVPAQKIQDSFDLAPNTVLENHKIGFFPINNVSPADLPKDSFWEYASFASSFQLRETLLINLLIRTSDVFKDLLVLDILGHSVSYRGIKYDFTKDQILFLRILAVQKQLSLKSESPTDSLNGVSVLKKIGSTSKRASDLFRSRKVEFDSIVDEVSSGEYQIKGDSIRIVGG